MTRLLNSVYSNNISYKINTIIKLLSYVPFIMTSKRDFCIQLNNSKKMSVIDFLQSTPPEFVESIVFKWKCVQDNSRNFLNFLCFDGCRKTYYARVNLNRIPSVGNLILDYPEIIFTPPMQKKIKLSKLVNILCRVRIGLLILSFLLALILSQYDDDNFIGYFFWITFFSLFAAAIIGALILCPLGAIAMWEPREYHTLLHGLDHKLNNIINNYQLALTKNALLARPEYLPDSIADNIISFLYTNHCQQANNNYISHNPSNSHSSNPPIEIYINDDTSSETDSLLYNVAG